MVNNRIVVIGLATKEDKFTLGWIGAWLEEFRPELKARPAISLRDYDVYDMTTRPEKGDALDAIAPGVELVIALHLFGIDKLPGGRTAEATAYAPKSCYNRENIRLLGLCMEIGAALVSVGDQPWLGMQKRTVMHSHSPEIVLYERKPCSSPEAQAAPQASTRQPR